MPRSEDQLAARLLAARDGAVSTGHLHPYKGFKCARTVSSRRTEKLGSSSGEARRYRL
jgi:hypothetical protein